VTYGTEADFDRALFSALDSRAEFGNIMKSIAAYSRRV
jgi:hypothetical protein